MYKDFIMGPEIYVKSERAPWPNWITKLCSRGCTCISSHLLFFIH